METAAATATNRWRETALAAVLVAAVLLCYAGALRGQFIWNDSEYVTAPALQPVAGLERIWTELGATEQYYPLLHSAFWVQHRIFGDDPLGYHVVTLLLHAAAAILFALLLRRLAIRGAWLAALLFALHPVHVESVAWITEQKNTLSTVFYLASALAYLRFDENLRPGPYVAGLVLFALSLFCKTVTATLPAALWVVLWWKRGRLTWKGEVRPLVPWLLLGAAAGVFSSWVEQRYVGAQGTDFAPPGIARLLVAGRAIWFYLGKLVWPFDLNFIYPRWQVDPRDPWQWLFPLGVVALAAGLWSVRRRSRAPLAALLLFVGSLFPVLGFVNLYGARYSFVWDHWQYLADLAPLAFVGAALMQWHDRLAPPWRALALAAAAGVVALFGVASWRHSAMFHDDDTLYRTTLARNPGCWLAENNLAFMLAGEPGRANEAVTHYERALRIRPDYPEAHVNLANTLKGIPGRLPEALDHYREAIRIRPDYAEAEYNLANALAPLPGRVREAIAHYERALRIKPRFAQAHLNLANLLGTMPDRVDEALRHYEDALRIAPDFAEAHYDLAMQLSLLPGREAEAQAHYEEALRLQPDNAEAHNNLAVIYARAGRLADARKHWLRALELDPNYADPRRNLQLLQNLPAK